MCKYTFLPSLYITSKQYFHHADRYYNEGIIRIIVTITLTGPH